MTWALLAIVVVCLVGLAVLTVTWRRTRAAEAVNRTQVAHLKRQVADATRQATDAQQRADDDAAAARAERRRAQEADDRVIHIEGELALARQQALANAEARAELDSLWALALLEQERVWRLTMALPASGLTNDHPRGLVEVIEADLARIREETGTPGRLHPAVNRQIEAGEAVVALRAVQAMLGAITRYSDTFDLHLATDDAGLDATLVCENFDGPDSVAEEASALYRAVAPSGGALDIDRDAEGRLQARLRLPRH